MPAYKLIEIDCPLCGPREQLEERSSAGNQEVCCDRCGELAEVLLSAPLVACINPKNSDFGARQTERLDKRSKEASVKRKDVRIEAARAQLRKATSA